MLTAGTFRHPGALAIAAAQVDVMSGGRLEFGLGAGWYEKEHLAYGIPFPASPAERLARLEEQLAIITGLWRTPDGSTFTYEGTFFQLSEGPALPKPHQRPSPPVIVGGRGLKKTPALAARFADEWNLPFQSLEQARVILASKEPACETLGRDPGSLRCSVALTTVCGLNDAELARRLAGINRDVDSVRNAGLYGTPEQIAERLSGYAELGISRVYVQLLDISDLDEVALIGEELAPLVAEL
jgi:alkanesulfonate monooxygenase